MPARPSDAEPNDADQSAQNRRLNEDSTSWLRRAARSLRRRLEHPRLPWHLAVLAMLLCAPALGLRWQTDDHIHRVSLVEQPGPREVSDARAEVFAHIKGHEAVRSPAKLFAFLAGDKQINRQAVHRGYLPWWTHEALHISFFRPVTGLTHWLDYQLWPQLPLLMHLHSLLWFGAVVVAVALFYRRMFLGGWVAGLAAVLYAVDDAHGLPAVWLANRNATIGAFFGLLALIAHDRWRRDQRLISAVAAPLALLLGVLANEGVVAVGGYLLAYALFVDQGSWRTRFGALLPAAMVGAAWWLFYKAAGYGVSGCGLYVDPGTSPLRFLGAVVQRAPLLMMGQWAIPSDLQWLMSHRAVQGFWLAAMILLVLMAVALVPLLRRDPLARFFALGMTLALLPCCATFASDRLLFFVGIGGMGLLAQFIAAVLQKAEWLPQRRSWRGPAGILAAVLILFHLGVAPVSLAQMAGNVQRFEDVFVRATESIPTDAEIQDQTVLIVHSPTFFISALSLLQRAVDDRPYPARAFVLGSAVDATEIHRPDERTLLVRPAGGFLALAGRPPAGQGEGSKQPFFNRRYGFAMLDRLYRDATPFRVGQQIELDGMTVEITALTDDGRPAEAAFRLAHQLEHPALRWLRWDDGVYVDFDPPPVGQTRTLPAISIRF